MSCDRAMIPLFTMSGPPSMTLIAQAFRLVSSWEFATSTVFQKLSAPRNPTDQGPVASILTPISPRPSLLKSAYLAHGSLALVQLDCGFSVPPAVTCAGQLSQTAWTPEANCELLRHMKAPDHPILPWVSDELCLRLRQLRVRLCELFPCLIDRQPETVADRSRIAVVLF